jgi:methylamine dehydrogenase accessory protein MauD
MVAGWDGTPLVGGPARYRFPRDRGLFLLYLSPHCSVCAALLPSAKRFLKEIAREAEGAWVMVLGQPETQIRYARESGLTPAVVWGEEQLPSLLRIGGAPFGLWIDATGKVRAKGMVNNREHLESLFNAVRAGHPTAESYVAAMAEAKEQARETSAPSQEHESFRTSRERATKEIIP